MLDLAEGATVYEVAAVLGVGEQTLRDWLHAFVRGGTASLVYRCPPRRPTKLSRSQREELLPCVLAGPEALGHPTGCWTAVLIADLIQARVHVTYHPRFIPHLLGALGLSDQTTKFSAAGADDEAALLWFEETWPEIVRVAQDTQALVLSGDEASFAQWGRWATLDHLQGVSRMAPDPGSSAHSTDPGQCALPRERRPTPV